MVAGMPGLSGPSARLSVAYRENSHGPEFVTTPPPSDTAGCVQARMSPFVHVPHSANGKVLSTSGSTCVRTKPSIITLM